MEKDKIHSKLSKENLITDRLIQYSMKKPVRFHMPGHKGKNEIFDKNSNISLKQDVTELPETDHLYLPQDIFLNAGIAAAKAFGSAFTQLCAGGATLALQSAVWYAAKLSKETNRPIFADRHCHMSIMNAFILSDIQPVWYFPCDKALTEKILKEKPCVLIITSPDYYGKFYLNEKLINLCHSVGCYVFCDNSHGTHLAFYKKGIYHPLSMGTDLVVDSAHKTLPTLTGGAFLHLSASLEKQKDEFLKYMRIFGSSSPSYLILSALDNSRVYMQKYGEKELIRVEGLIRDIRKKLSLLGFTFLNESESDIFRLTINSSCIKIDSRDLYNFLCFRNIYCEFADMHQLICICTVADDEDMYHQLYQGICEYIKQDRKDFNIQQNQFEKKLPRRYCSLRQATFYPTEEILIEQAQGRVSAESYVPYPPGIPCIMPGEYFDKSVIASLREHFNKVRIISAKEDLL